MSYARRLSKNEVRELMSKVTLLGFNKASSELRMDEKKVRSVYYSSRYNKDYSDLITSSIPGLKKNRLSKKNPDFESRMLFVSQCMIAKTDWLDAFKMYCVKHNDLRTLVGFTQRVNRFCADLEDKPKSTVVGFSECKKILKKHAFDGTMFKVTATESNLQSSVVDINLLIFKQSNGSYRKVSAIIQEELKKKELELVNNYLHMFKVESDKFAILSE